MDEGLKTKRERIWQALEELLDIIVTLRSPRGCPWDREQTHSSLIRGTIEEAYEVVQAIEEGSDDDLKEELGDLLLQVLMHGEIADERGAFDLGDIARVTGEKMVRRHPHIFGEKSGQTLVECTISVDKVEELWENVKRDENPARSESEGMKRIPRHLPALLRSEKIQAKAGRVGFDWDDVGSAFEKVKEELAELEEASRQLGRKEIQHEVGDLLFACVNAARMLDIDPEKALQEASARFIGRFSFMEEEAESTGRPLKDWTLPEMDGLWEKAKAWESLRGTSIRTGGENEQS